MLELILSAFLIMLASLIGVVAVWNRAGNFIQKNLHYLLSFSAGVFLVIAYHIGGEAIEHTGSLLIGLAWIGFGALSIWATFRYMPALHHHHAGDHTRHTIDPRRLMLTDGIHNFGDGILLAGSYIVSPVLGATATVSVFVHEALQEVAEFFVFREAGWSIRKALGANFLVSSTVLLGAIGGYLLLDALEPLVGPMLGISAGAFLVIVFHDLIPHSLRDAVSMKHIVKHVGWFALGLVLMTMLTTALPHQDTHDTHQDTHTEEPA